MWIPHLLLCYPSRGHYDVTTLAEGGLTTIKSFGLITDLSGILLAIGTYGSTCICTIFQSFESRLIEEPGSEKIPKPSDGQKTVHGSPVPQFTIFREMECFVCT